MATTASKQVVQNRSLVTKLEAPASTEILGDPGSGEEMWEKKFMALQRKCVEYEQINNTLCAKAVRIHEMIEQTEEKKKFLLKRLEHFQGFELPNSKSWDDESSQEDNDVATAVAKIRADIDAQIKSTNDSQTSSHGNSKTNILPPPALLGPSSSSRDVSLEPVTPKAQVANAHTVITTPKFHAAMSSPTASIILTPTLVSATVPVVVTATTATNAVPTKSKKGTKGVKRDANSSEKGTTKKRRADVDPNAPKKPSNAFFWFCQDKRAMLQEQFRGEGMAGQHDLTKALARLWSETKIEDRKIYYDRYATDKARYEREMEEYTRNKQNALLGLQTPHIVTITANEH